MIAALGARPATPALSISSASTSSSAGDSPPSSPTTHVDSTSKPTFHTPPKPSGTGGLFFASKDNSYRAYEVTTLPTLLDVKTTTAPAHHPTASGYRAYEVTTQNHGEITSTSPPSNSGRHGKRHQSLFDNTHPYPAAPDDNLPAISVIKPRMTTSREAPDRPESPDLGVVPDVARALRKSYRLTSRYRCQSSCTPHKQCPPLSRSTSAVSAQSAPERLESNKTDPPPVAANTQTLTAQPSPTSTNKRPKVPAPLPLGAAHATRPSGASAPGTRAQSSVDPDAQLPPTPTLRQQFRSEGFAMRRPPTASRAGVETAWF